MITNDETYLKQLQSEKWFSYSGFIDTDKIKSHLPSFKYLIEEITKLESYCTDKVFEHVMSKPNLFESQNAKNLCRNGVPPKYMHDFLLKLFDIKVKQSHYEDVHRVTFNGHDPKNVNEFVPYYTGKTTLNESLPIHFLNEKGIQALKEILWMINGIIGNIEFSPLIIKITSMILMFCTKQETFEFMSKLLEHNYNLKETYNIRWHIRLTYNDNLKIITSIVESLREISLKSGKESFDHFTHINFPPEKLYEDMCYGFFMDYFNFFGILRLLPFFLLEGIKTFYRLSYAVVKTLKNDIQLITSPDEVINIMRKKSYDMHDMTALFNLSYTFGLTRYNNKYDFQSIPNTDLFKGKRNNYYLPKMKSPSTIMSDNENIHLWEVLPLELKIKDANLIYSTGNDGYALSTILALNNKFDYETTIMFIIETADNEIIGGVISNLIKHTNGKSIRPFFSLLLKIRPEIKIYQASEEKEDVLYVDSECVMFGNGPKGPAIRFDKDLKGGFSYEGGCFNNEKLVSNENGEFQIKKMEIYHLD